MKYSIFYLLIFLNTLFAKAQIVKNEVLIINDEQGYSIISHDDNLKIKTPNIDKIASSRNTRLDNFYESEVNTSTKPQQYLISFHRPDALVIVNEYGKVQWKAEPKLKHPQDVGITSKGHILCSDYSGAVCIGFDNQIKWRASIPEGTQNPVAFPLEKDRFLVGVEGPTLLREINSKGDILKELQFNTSYEKVHGQFRVCRKTEMGTYLIPFTLEGAVREYNVDGKLIRDFGAYKLAVGALRLPNGNTLISFYDGIVEIDSNDKIVWEFITKRDCNFSFGNAIGMAKLKNGNVVTGFYSKNPEVPNLIEISPDKKIVKSINVKGYTNIGHFQILEDNYKPSSEVLIR